ncbi:hypothetical protein PIB30_047559 [Stylosanthes scabra]|uniref:Uncharacterized protein n=1 Tax=Stylosanthes scabra TaxID=79078 RepID=A0ABU6UFH0_9FABA|nr:hypothetical protein [Stylosanthes scabra]
MQRDERTNETYCTYSSDVATGYGVGSFLFLLSGESLLMGVTKCMCFGRPLNPGGNRAWSIIYFMSSWVTFIIAEACLIAGATKNAYHTKYRGMIYAQNFSCESLRKGIFIAGAIFVVATMILNVYYYMYFTKATTTTASSHKGNRASPTVGPTRGNNKLYKEKGSYRGNTKRNCKETKPPPRDTLQVLSTAWAELIEKRVLFFSCFTQGHIYGSWLTG